MVKCPYCGFSNEEGTLFCEQCKSDLSVAADNVPMAQPVAQAAQAAADVPMAAPVEAPLHSVAAPEADVAAAAAAGLHEQPTMTPEAAATLSAPMPADETGHSMQALASTGAPAAQPAGDSAAPTPLAEGSHPKLVVVRGLRLNTEYPLYEGENYVGRTDEKPVDIDLEDQEPPDRIWSSRQHALIHFVNYTLVIEDLNSQNGTFVNRTRVYPGQKRGLQVGDVIQIGTVQLRIKV